MVKDIITIVDEIGRKEGMPNGIQFQNMHHKSMLSDFFADQVGHDDNDSCVSNDDWEYTNKAKHEEDVKFISDMNIGADKLEDINDMGEEDDVLQ